MTKEQERIYNIYKASKYYNLSDVYARPSTSKIQAYDKCLMEMCEMDGYEMRILTFNTFQFTCAYRYDESRNGLLITHLVYFTASKREDIVINVYSL